MFARGSPLNVHYGNDGLLAFICADCNARRAGSITHALGVAIDRRTVEFDYFPAMIVQSESSQSAEEDTVSCLRTPPLFLT